MKLKLKKLLKIALPFSALAVAVPLIATSCATTSDSNNGGTGGQVQAGTVQQKSFKTEVKTTSRNRAATKATPTNPNSTHVLDPNINPDAQAQAKSTFATLDKEKLQKDFDSVLTKFFKVHEYESETEGNGTETEVEAELRRVEVIDYNSTTLTANLKVTYWVEKETEDDKNDTETESKGEETQNKTLTLVPQFATQTEIKAIEKMLKDADKKDQGDMGNNYETDIDDLIELYIGDPEDNEKSIFEQINAFKDTNKHNLGGLLGYSVDVSKLQYTPATQTRKAIQPLQVFAPSSVITEFYYPETVFEGVDLTLDYDKLSQKTETEVKAINSKEQLKGILMVPQGVDKANITSVEIKDLVSTPSTDTPAPAADQNQQPSTPVSDSLEVLVTFNGQASTPTPPTKPEGENGGNQQQDGQQGQGNNETAPKADAQGGTDTGTPSPDANQKQGDVIKLVIKKSWLKQANSGK